MYYDHDRDGPDRAVGADDRVFQAVVIPTHKVIQIERML